MAISKATASSVAPAAKGDLVVGSGTNDAAVLAVGSANQVLTVDSSTTTGLKWAAASSGALTFITRNTFTNVASVTIDNVFDDALYENYIAHIQVASAGNLSTTLTMRGVYSGSIDTTAGYYGAIGRAYSSVNVTQSGGTTSFTLSDDCKQTFRCSLNFVGVTNSSYLAWNGAGANFQTGDASFIGCVLGQTRDWTGFQLIGSNNITGVVSIYGLAKS